MTVDDGIVRNLEFLDFADPSSWQKVLFLRKIWQPRPKKAGFFGVYP